jgi:hypothetical protein
MFLSQEQGSRVPILADVVVFRPPKVGCAAQFATEPPCPILATFCCRKGGKPRSRARIFPSTVNHSHRNYMSRRDESKIAPAAN